MTAPGHFDRIRQWRKHKRARSYAAVMSDLERVRGFYVGKYRVIAQPGQLPYQFRNEFQTLLWVAESDR